MAYATQSDLSPGIIPARTLVQLTDDSNSNAVDTDVVQEKLDQASGTIEMYCRARYALPLQQTRELTGMAAAIAAYMLYSRRASQVPEPIKDGYTYAIQMLKDISTGKAGLDSPVVGGNEQTGSGNVVVSRKRRSITDCNLEGYTG
ncbi:MAG TPA: DUF1320 domain-containing protein [Acidobacteriaceae bacterium]|jgi:phage gp36-like protein